MCAIHKAAVRPATVQNDLRRSFLPAAPIGSQWTLFCSTGIVPGKAGNGSAGGFVNSAGKYHVPDKIRYHNIYVNLYSSLQRDVNKPLKFFITSFLADPGLLLANGDACLLNPLLGLLRAEKLALFCVSAISVVTSSCLSFLVCDDLFWFSDECLRFFMWLFSLFSLCSCKGALAAFERGIHTFDVATRMANKVYKYLQKSLFITKLSRSWIPVTKNMAANSMHLEPSIHRTTRKYFVLRSY